MESCKPEAKRFNHWVTAEVLPSIRKTEVYTVGQKPMTATRALAQVIAVSVRHSHQPEQKTISSFEPFHD